jgi:hypothetical protein
MKSNDVKRGIAYEKRVAKQHHAKHLGGPGRADYIRGKTKGEVKNTKKKVTFSVIECCIKKHGSNEFVSKNGYGPRTAGAVREKYPQVTLFHRTKKILAKKNKS